MNNPTPAVFDAIKEAAEEALAKARDSRSDMGAVNWADLRVVEVLFCCDSAGDTSWRVLIEEASPDSPLATAVYLHLKEAFSDQVFDVATEW